MSDKPCIVLVHGFWGVQRTGRNLIAEAVTNLGATGVEATMSVGAPA